MDTVKLTIRAVLLGGLALLAGYAAWSWRGHHDAGKVDAAVHDTLVAARAQVLQEHQWDAAYQSMADLHFAPAPIALVPLQGAQRHTQIIRTIAAAPTYYQQPLPPEGYALWIAARAAFTSPSPSSPAWPAASATTSARPTSAPMTKPGSP